MARDGHRLVVESSLAADASDPIVLGESIAVDGCCLTTVCGGALEFEISPETFSRTVAGSYAVGSKVNLERAMKASDRFGGHIVQGHVDAVGSVVGQGVEDEWVTLTFDAGLEGDRYLIDKGSVTVNGVSLTVVRPEGGVFSVALIPHTLAATNLGRLEVGSVVNLEFDVLAKHVEKLMASR